MSTEDEAVTRLGAGWLSLEQAIGETLGAATVAWTPNGPGDPESILDTDRLDALRIELEKYITTAHPSLLNPNRSKGEKIVADCLLHDEPFFVFRARDIFATLIIRQYLKALEDMGPNDPDFQANIVGFLNDLREWQKTHVTQVRYPD